MSNETPTGATIWNWITLISSRRIKNKLCLKYSGGRYYCSFAVSFLRHAAPRSSCFACLGFWVHPGIHKLCTGKSWEKRGDERKIEQGVERKRVAQDFEDFITQRSHITSARCVLLGHYYLLLVTWSCWDGERFIMSLWMKHVPAAL